MSNFGDSRSKVVEIHWLHYVTIDFNSASRRLSSPKGSSLPHLAPPKLLFNLAKQM